MATNGSPELLIVMGAGATADQTEHVLARLQEAGVSARVQRGREATVIGAIGERELLATLPLEGYPGVEQVLPVVTELMDPRHVEAVLDAADVIQIGARNSQNFLLLAEVGRADKPVLLKRGLSSSVEELLMAAEYVAKEGNERIILCERGIKTFETATRFTLDLGAVAVLKQETHLPVIVDPSHAAGKRELVLPLARAAAAVGADGIIVETHPRPEEALSDGPQQIPSAEFGAFAREVEGIVALMGKQIG